MGVLFAGRGLFGFDRDDAPAVEPPLAPATAGTGALRSPPPPAYVPSGYTREQRGTARWLYPNAAEGEVDKLEPLRKRTWNRLANDLGVYLPPDIDIRIGVNPEHMQQIAPAGYRLPAYATGVAFPDEGLVLLSMAEPQQWMRPNLGQVLAHELAHVALHRAVGGNSVPRWLTEGFAIHEADERSLARVRTLWEGTLRGDLMDLSRLSASFPDQHHGEVDLAYAQAADLAGTLLGGELGPNRFRGLVSQLRAGTPLEEAVLAAYGMPLERIEQRWRTQLAQRFGRWPTVLGGLTFVWALAAILLVIGYVRVRRRQQKTLERWAIEEAPLLAPVSQPPPPPPPQRTPADDVLDAWGERQHRDPGVPTIVHEGRSYTLH
ncbi:MAG TPA: hypothetical protein VK509_10330 [Polyangiales bacterium]|nr:hypothetical protein [Polyangiales bacterium]